MSRSAAGRSRPLVAVPVPLPDEAPTSPAVRLRPVVVGTDGEARCRARAYTGDAHHHEWSVRRDDPPEYVDLPLATRTRRYRLVRHPRTGAPAVDHSGAFVYVPAPDLEGP